MAKDPTLGFLVHDIARLIRQEFAGLAERHHATQTHLRTVAYLSRMEGCTQRELAEVIDVRPITLGRQIDHLESTGLIERRAHPTDRRCFRLYLTDRGRGEVEELRKISNTIIARATRRLSQAETDSMLRLLGTVHDTLLQDRSDAAQSGQEARHAV